MQITVRFEAQVRRAAGAASESLEVDASATVADVVRALARDASAPLRRVLLDDAGNVRPTVMLFLDDEYVRPGDGRPIGAAAVLTITSPISGG